MEVGGDWYDVIPLSAERVALVIGDVMGHGLSEAATMGRLRTAVHTLADLELPPDELLAHLNDLVAGLGERLLRHLPVRRLRPHHPDCSFATRRAPAAGPRPPRRHRRTSRGDPDPPLGAAEPPFEHRGAAPAGGQPAGPLHRRPGRVRHPRHRRGHGATWPRSSRTAGTPASTHRRRDAGRALRHRHRRAAPRRAADHRRRGPARRPCPRDWPREDIAAWPLPDDPRPPGRPAGTSASSWPRGAWTTWR